MQRYESQRFTARSSVPPLGSKWPGRIRKKSARERPAFSFWGHSGQEQISALTFGRLPEDRGPSGPFPTAKTAACGESAVGATSLGSQDGVDHSIPGVGGRLGCDLQSEFAGASARYGADARETRGAAELRPRGRRAELNKRLHDRRAAQADPIQLAALQSLDCARR